MADTLRAFIAISLPQEVRQALAGVQGKLADRRFPIRWVNTESIHLTLKFLGEIFVSNVGPIMEVMERAAQNHAGFKATAKGLGVFPGYKNPRIVWAGLTGGVKTLADLSRDLETGLEELGFARENRPFSAHLTLGRVKAPVDGRVLARAMEEAALFEAPEFDVTAITLYKSDLQRTGPVYTVVGEARLGAEDR